MTTHLIQGKDGEKCCPRCNGMVFPAEKMVSLNNWYHKVSRRRRRRQEAASPSGATPAGTASAPSTPSCAATPRTWRLSARAATPSHTRCLAAAPASTSYCCCFH